MHPQSPGRLCIEKRHDWKKSTDDTRIDIDGDAKQDKMTVSVHLNANPLDLTLKRKGKP